MIKKNSKGRTQLPWLPEKLGKVSDLRTKLITNMSDRSDDWSEYKEQQRMTKRLIRRTKSEYERKLVGNV